MTPGAWQGAGCCAHPLVLHMWILPVLHCIWGREQTHVFETFLEACG